MGIIQHLSAVLIVAFLSIPSVIDAASSIILNGEEKQLVDQGDIITREVATNNKPGRTFEAIARINASRELIVKVLTAYEKYPEFMPNVKRIDIVEAHGNDTVVNYTLTLPMGTTKRYRLKITVIYPDKKHSKIQWQLQDWPELKAEETIKDTNGYWLIEEQAQNSSLVKYHVYTDPGPIPFGLGWIVDVLSKNSVPKALNNTKSRAEKMAGTSESGMEKNSKN